MKGKIVVIGGGIGGLSTAALLAKEGHSVTLIEKNAMLGGRARQWKTKGFSFDMGPSWYMMPEVFEQYFDEFEKSISDMYDLRQLNTHYDVVFGSGNRYKVTKDYSKTRKLFGNTKDLLKKFDTYMQKSEQLYSFATSDLVYLDHNSITQVLSPKVLLKLPRMKLTSSFHDYVKKYVPDEEKQKMLEFATVFLGGSPYNTPAFYSLITHADFRLGLYHPIGGMYKIVETLSALCQQYGVKIYKNKPVTKISVKNGRASEVVTKTKTFDTDIVVSGADYQFTETKLLEKKYQTYPTDYWSKKTMSPSGFLLYLGIKGKIKNLSHHLLYFSQQWNSHFSSVYQKPSWPENPSYYVHCPTKTDNTLAPKDHEAVMVLVPVAPNLKDNDTIRAEFAEKVIQHLESVVGESLSKRIVVKRIFSHRDFKNDYNAYQGSAFGMAHTLSQTALFRPKNKSKKVSNLYYVGQYTNPGIGVPMCILSSQIIRNMIRHDYS